MKWKALKRSSVILQVNLIPTSLNRPFTYYRLVSSTLMDQFHKPQQAYQLQRSATEQTST
jgi:hypothetical protein